MNSLVLPNPSAVKTFKDLHNKMSIKGNPYYFFLLLQITVLYKDGAQSEKSLETVTLKKNSVTRLLTPFFIN